MIAAKEAGLLKLGQNAVDRGQTNVGIVVQKMFENILRGHVPLRAFLKDFQNLLSRNGGLKSRAFEFVHEFELQMKERGIGEFASPEPNATATMT